MVEPALDAIKQKLLSNETIIPKKGQIIRAAVGAFLLALASALWLIFREYVDYPNGIWVFTFVLLLLMLGICIWNLVIIPGRVLTDHGRIFSMKTGRCVYDPME